MQCPGDMGAKAISRMKPVVLCLPNFIVLIVVVSFNLGARGVGSQDYTNEPCARFCHVE